MIRNDTYPKAILDKYSGNNNNNDFTTDTSLKWKVWSIDTNNLYLVSDKLVSKGGYNSGLLYLYNPIGYNNGVTLLDQLCNTCYSNSSYNGLTARSLKLEDVLAVTTVSNSAGSLYETQAYEYEIATPYIWNEYESQTKDIAINHKSIAYELTTNTLTNTSIYKPYYTLFYNTKMNTISAYKYEKYKDLVTSVASRQTYWLSSRAVAPQDGSTCYFALQTIISTGISREICYKYGTSEATTAYRGVRPFITIPLSSCTITEVDANNWTIAPKA